MKRHISDSNCKVVKVIGLQQEGLTLDWPHGLNMVAMGNGSFFEGCLNPYRRCKPSKTSVTSTDRSHIVYGCSLLYHESQALLFAVGSIQPLSLSILPYLDATPTCVSHLDYFDSSLLTRSYAE